MKLVLTVIHDEDSHKLMDKLTEEGYMATKLASTGGLLRTGNTTLFVGVDKEKVDNVIDIIKSICKTTKQITLLNQPMTSIPEGFVSYPIEVTVGGATIFVVDVDKYLKI
ncbi:MAG: cyclic-di-AMP receptor [Eubacteriales bacterium]